jgi:hypothetical protein
MEVSDALYIWMIDETVYPPTEYIYVYQVPTNASVYTG